MSKYQNDAVKLLELVGGKENINAVTHCLTRMRFALVDPSLAQTEEIEKLSVVKGSFSQAGQFQVIVGNEVSEFHKTFVAHAGLANMSKEETKKADDDGKTWYSKKVAASFNYDLALPFEIDTDKAEASFEKGVISISAPRLQVSESRVLSIKKS